MNHDLTKGEKRALREAAELAHQRDVAMPIEDRDVHYLEARNPDLPLVVAAAVADGLLTEDEVREPARERVRDLAARIRSMRRHVADRPATEPPDPYVADAPVSVGAILELVDLLGDLGALYVNRKTGEAVVLGEDELSMLEDDPDDAKDEDDAGEPGAAEDDDPDSLPQWQRDSMKQIREIRESEDWLQLVTRLDFDDYAIMKRFANRARPSVSKALLEALHGKGAYRRFRDEIDRSGSRAEWEAFRTESIAREIRDSLDTKGVPYRR
jgi:hypothetical protein